MINWDSIRYSIEEATSDFNNVSININNVTPIKLSDDFAQLRNELLDARDEIYNRYNLDTANKLDYKFDLLYGIKIYTILNETRGFTKRVASDDSVWMFLSIRVIPDVVHARWGLNEDHYYKMTRRIWLKTIWWYIHLSWINDESDTFKLLENNNTDTILQLVERPGIGYYVDLYREIMYQYPLHKNASRDLFRKVLKLNTAKLITVTPELVDGGIPSYVNDLYKEVVDLNVTNS